MCGIAGYSGKKNAKIEILDALSTLEYRGYDSCGIAYFDNNNNIHIIKNTGRVNNLKEKCTDLDKPSISCLGHTRWATHGGVTNKNEHPHEVENVVMIHNGIIENYKSLIDEYNMKGKLNSETDSEVACFCLNILYKENDHNPLIAIKQLVTKIRGTFAFLIMFKDIPNKIYAVRNTSPLVCAKTNDESIIVSDLTALIKYTKEYSVVPEKTIIEASENDLIAYDIETLEKVSLKKDIVNWDINSAMKGGFAHYMLKEIFDEPDAINNTIMPRIINDKINLDDDNIHIEDFNDIKHIHVVACGTALHAGRVVAEVFTKMIRINIESYIASEYRYNDPLIDNETLVIVISQSGETIDTYECLREAKRKGAKVLSIVNVKDSTIARESDMVLYTHAGPEIAVASTKAYISQIAILYIFFFWYAHNKKLISDEALKNYLDNFKKVPEEITETLKLNDHIKDISKVISYYTNCFYIGRGYDYISSLEGALKLKEISYIHTEAYAAGELKHGTIALITDNVPVIAINTQKKVSEKTLSNVREVKARNAQVILITCEDLPFDNDIIDYLIMLKPIDEMFRIFIVSIATQLLAYHTSVIKGLDVDKPRNLAKSVTVE